MKIWNWIAWILTTLGFMFIAVFLSVWTGVYHYLWFLVIPILGYLDLGFPKEEKEVKTVIEYRDKSESEPELNTENNDLEWQNLSQNELDIIATASKDTSKTGEKAILKTSKKQSEYTGNRLL